MPVQIRIKILLLLALIAAGACGNSFDSPIEIEDPEMVDTFRVRLSQQGIGFVEKSESITLVRAEQFQEASEILLNLVAVAGGNSESSDECLTIGSFGSELSIEDSKELCKAQ